MPIRNHSTRKNANLPSAPNSSPPLNLADTAMVENSTISTIPMMSSIISVPNTIPAKGLPFRPISSYDLATTIVEDIGSIPPRNMLSILVHPRACPITNPMVNIPSSLQADVMMAVLPDFTSFLKLNSNPKPNIIKMIPISDHWWTLSMLEMPGKNPMLGPIRNPATIYPRIKGCLRALDIMVNTPAEMRMTARSRTKLSSSDMLRGFAFFFVSFY